MLISTSPHSFPLPLPLIPTNPPSPSPPPQSDLLTDIFSSSPSPPPSHSPHPHPTAHPSDIPRLRSQHSTAGYRDGLSSSKPSALQPGFDEGYPLGAVLGLKAGELLGVLEGICAALKPPGLTQAKSECENTPHPESPTQPERPAEIHITAPRRASLDSASPTAYARLTRLRHQAVAELALQRIFAAEFWGTDGLWTWAVPAPAPAGGGERSEAVGDGEAMEAPGEDVTFEDVAAAHPLIGKWSAVVEEVGREWGVRKGVWAGEEWEAGRVGEGA